MKVFYLGVVLLFNINIPVYSQDISNKAPVHYMLPLTTKENLKSCDEFFNVKEAYEKSLSCANKRIFYKHPYHKSLRKLKDIPQCFIVMATSPDVVQARVLNYLNYTPLVMAGIVGFYDDEANIIYVIENFDAEQILIHEYQHYFLRIADKDANGAHDHKIWKKCSPPKYTPSDANLKRFFPIK